VIESIKCYHIFNLFWAKAGEGIIPADAVISYSAIYNHIRSKK
jgi:hypothetical protein